MLSDPSRPLPPPPACIGVDAASRNYTGIACLVARPSGLPELVELHAIRMLPPEEGGLWRAAEERLWPVVDRLCADHPDAPLVVEQAPPTAHQDTGKKGRQAAIGFPLGLVAGLVCARRLDPRPRLVDPGEWRRRMLELGQGLGLGLSAPRREGESAPAPGPLPPKAIGADGISRVGKLFRIRYRCGHEVDFAPPPQDAPSLCPRCSGPQPVDRRTDAERIRDEWKAVACRFVASLWPDKYSALVAGASSRAANIREDHQLAGVADACEAVGVALWGLLS